MAQAQADVQSVCEELINKALSDEQIEYAEMGQIVQWISQRLNSKFSYTHECKLQNQKLIERLCEFEQLKNLGTEGKTTEEFMALAEIFEPINEAYFINPPDNLHKLYELLMVKINDIHSLRLDKSQKHTQYLQDQSPNPDLFASKKIDGKKASVEYFCSLIRVQKWPLNNLGVWGEPQNLDEKCAETSFVKRNAEIMEYSVRSWLVFNAIVQLIFVILGSMHICTWDDTDYNDAIVPLMFIVAIYKIAFPFIWNCFAVVINLPVVLKNPTHRGRLSDIIKVQSLYFSDPMRVFRLLSPILWIFYLAYFSSNKQHLGIEIAALANFLSYITLIGYMKMIPFMRKQLEVIMYVAQKTFVFYAILMIYVFGNVFAHMALKLCDENETQDNSECKNLTFREAFEQSYRATFTDFSATEDRTDDFELIAFLVMSYFGPMILLLLLVSVMEESFTEYLESWHLEKIRATHNWTAEVFCLKISLQFPFNCCRVDWIFRPFYEDKGYIHYCIPAHQYGEKETWEGKVNQIQGKLKASEHRIIAAVKDHSDRGENSWDDSNLSNNRGPRSGSQFLTISNTGPRSGQVSSYGTEINQRIDALERNVNERYDALERNMADLNNKISKLLELGKSNKRQQSKEAV